MSDHTHPPVSFPWRSDLRAYGIDRAPDMAAAGSLLRAARDNCEECMYAWAKGVLEGDPLVVAHLLGSSVTLARDLGADLETVYRASAWSLIQAMLDDDITHLVILAEQLTTEQRTQVLEDALAVFTALTPVPEK